MAKRSRGPEAHTDEERNAKRTRTGSTRNESSSRPTRTGRRTTETAAHEISTDCGDVPATGERGTVFDEARPVQRTEGGNPKLSAGQRTSKKNRFIVFVGNLPYSATNESIASHFEKIHPDSIRHITERANPKGIVKPRKNQQPKSKGFAFLEFNGYDRMKTCLKLYHHSDFNDGKSPMRKINVELTAGGGGKGDARREKLKSKNAKLDEERRQRMQARQADKAGAEVERTEEETTGRGDDIHPSRRARISTNVKRV